LSNKGLVPPAPADFARIPFPFVSGGADRETALSALDTAIAVLVEGPELDQAIAGATERFDLEEQGRLRLRKAELDQQLKDLLRT